MVEVALHIKNTHIGYGAATVLRDLTLPPLSGGRVVGLLGPNASGKSTLIRTITGIHPLQSGEVSLELDGVTCGPAERRKACGYVPQDLPTTASLTAFETALVAARRQCATPVERTAEVFHELQIDHIAHRYLGELSGGQRQLVGAAQMLVGQAAVMLLDEPTSALDLHHQLFLLQHLRERALREGSLVIVALHDVNLATRFCDTLLLLHNGQLHSSGTPAEVVQPEAIRQVYRVEAEIVDHHGMPIMTPQRAC